MLRRTFLGLVAAVAIAGTAAAQPDGARKPWDDLSPEERETVMQHFYRMHHRGPHGWDAMRDRWDHMSPGDRRRYMGPMHMDGMPRMRQPGAPRPGMGPPAQRG